MIWALAFIGNQYSLERFSKTIRAMQISPKPLDLACFYLFGVLICVVFKSTFILKICVCDFWVKLLQPCKRRVLNWLALVFYAFYLPFQSYRIVLPSQPHPIARLASLTWQVNFYAHKASVGLFTPYGLMKNLSGRWKTYRADENLSGRWKIDRPMRNRNRMMCNNTENLFWNKRHTIQYEVD